MFMLLVKGLIMGFAIAAPVGPIGVLCIQRSLHDGFRIGFMTGLGAALADGTYGFIAAFGLNTISTFLITQQYLINLVGGLFLLYLGLKLFLKKPAIQFTTNDERSAFHAFGTSFLLTLTNPATILSFIAIFAGLGFNQTTGYSNAFILVIGIIIGSGIWWLALSSIVAFILHHRLTTTGIKKINRISGVIILAFGIFALYQVRGHP